MVDFTGNPYLSDPRLQLSDEQMRQYRLGSLGSALTGLGAGIAQSGAQGQPWFAGIAPGAAMASSAMSQQEARMAQMQDAAAKWAQMEDYRKAQEKEIGLKTSQLEMDQELQRRLLSGGGLPGLGGFQPPPRPMMGPGAAPPANGPPIDLQKAGPPMVDYLMSKANLPPVGAAAAVGGLYQESGFNPNAVGDNGTAGGMAQWRGERQAGLVKFAQAQGKPPSDPQTQLDYMIAEMKGGDMGAQRAYAMLQQAKTPEEGTAAMMHFFRPAGYTPNNPQGGHGFAQRVQYSAALTPQAGGPQSSAMPPQMVAQAGPPGMPQGGDAATGQPGTLPQSSQGAPQMPPGMPGPPPDASGMLPYMMSPRLAPLVTGALGQQKQQYDYQWKAYNAAQDAEKQRLANENAKVKIGADGQPVLNSMLPQAEALSAGATERAKLAPDITQGQTQAAADKAAAEETAKAAARMEYLFPKGYQTMKPDEIRTAMAQSNPLMLGTLDSLGKMDVAPSELSNRPAGAMGLTKAEMIAATKVLYPDYSVRTAENHKDFIDYMRPNEQGGKTAMSVANAAQHVADAADAYNALKNGQFPQGNKFFNEMATKFGWDKLTPFQTIQQAIGPEIAKVISAGSDNAVGEREAATELLASWNNPKTMAGVFDRVAGLIEKRRNSLYDQAKKAAVDPTFVDQSIGDYGTQALASLRSAIKVPEGKSAPQSAPIAPPVAGYEKNGYRFKGGDPSKSMNWEKIR